MDSGVQATDLHTQIRTKIEMIRESALKVADYSSCGAARADAIELAMLTENYLAQEERMSQERRVTTVWDVALLGMVLGWLGFVIWVIWG